MSTDWDETERRHRSTDGSSSRFVVLALILVAAFLGWARFTGRSSPPADPIPEHGVEESEATVIESVPLIELPPAEVRAPNREAGPTESSVGVYECSENGLRVFSDRPCGSEAQGRAVIVHRPDPRETARARQRTWQAQQSAGGGYSRPVQRQDTTLQGADAVAGQQKELRCAQIDREIDRINARMREGGYGTSEGNWLRGRWHDLKNERYDLRCGR